MENIDWALLKKPGRYAVIYMLIVLGVFLLGPISYFDGLDINSLLTIGLLLAYVFAFKFGYEDGNKRLPTATRSYYIVQRSYNESVAYNFMKYTVIFNAVITVLNALEYASAVNLNMLWNNAINGLLNPSDAYYHKDTSSRNGSLLSYINLVYFPIFYLTQVYSLIIFKKFKRPLKIVIVMTIIIEVMRWFAIGTNKGLLDVIILLLSVYLIKIWNKRFLGEEIKGLKRTKTLIILLVVAFLVFFGYVLSARLGGEYNTALFASFPYSIIPPGMRLFVERFDSYLTQGYGNFHLCISECQFRPTWGIGHSRFLMDVFHRLFGVNIFPSTYPAQLQQISGIDALAEWHSAFAWFASDVTPLGVTLLLYVFGRFSVNVVYEAIAARDIYSCTLFYFVVLAIVNSSCTNYVWAYSNMFIGFWGAFAMRWINRKKRSI